MPSRPPLRLLSWNYALVTLLSAFLLFQVQPLLSKFILPWFGGSPAVWTTAMLFFQSALFCGYAYAHISEHYMSRTVQMVVHLGLIVAACVMLPIAPSTTWKPIDSADPTWRILALLGVCVGLPYFVLSSTGPLIQAWFSRSFPGRSPYRLYSLSNLGSLAALLTYPTVFEPAWRVGDQATRWSWGFGVFGVLCAVAAVRVWLLSREPAEEALEAAADAEAGPPPAWRERLLWLALPAFASLVLLAATNHICQDVAVIPFLWVVPLSLYLLTFIICFDHSRWYSRRFFAILTAVSSVGVASIHSLDDIYEASYKWLADHHLPGIGSLPATIELNFVAELIMYFTALFSICMLCHGELVRLKPHPKYLTSFYLMISAGGALGGVFVSLVAPVIFSTHVEWDIALCGGYVLAAILLLAMTLTGEGQYRYLRGAIGSVLLGVGLAGIWYYQLHESIKDTSRDLAVTRNFYGVVSAVDRAIDDPDENDHALFNGRIIHGIQYVSDAKRHLPTTYYFAETGVGRALGYYRRQDDMRVGAIGLGVGTLASYIMPGQSIRIYEINPDVQKLAREHFTYLKDCQGKEEVVLGDARLSLEREDSQQFDVLVLDAFSGDAIPTHLLTKEAFDIYMRHLAPDGAIAVHITNRYLDLDPVVRRLAQEFNLDLVRIDSDSGADEHYSCDWMVLSRNADLLAALADAAAPTPEPRPEIPLWTDDQTNLFQILK